MAARHLRQRELPARLAELLAEQPTLPSGTLELEILETSALGDLALITELLEACRRLGVQVSLDDFGTGYSSLTYLKRLPAGTVKIDQSFVRDILGAPEDIKILAGVLGLANAFERQVIAEGVETLDHGQLLLRLGCELGQGYGIARPMPAEAVADWCQEWQPPTSWARQAPLAPSQLPLLIAGVEHRAWCRQLHHALEAGAGLSASPLASPTATSATGWPWTTVMTCPTRVAWRHCTGRRTPWWRHWSNAASMAIPPSSTATSTMPVRC